MPIVSRKGKPKWGGGGKKEGAASSHVDKRHERNGRDMEVVTDRTREAMDFRFLYSDWSEFREAFGEKPVEKTGKTRRSIPIADEESKSGGNFDKRGGELRNPGSVICIEHKGPEKERRPK